MAGRVSPWDSRFQRSKPLRRETKSFPCINPETGEDVGQEIELTFQEMDEVLQGVSVDKSLDYIERYVRGEDELLTPLGQRVQMSEYLSRVVANLEAIDCGPDPYSPLDWIGVAITWPGTWKQILDWANTFLPNRGPEGNSSRRKRKKVDQDISISSEPTTD